HGRQTELVCQRAARVLSCPGHLAGRAVLPPVRQRGDLLQSRTGSGAHSAGVRCPGEVRSGPPGCQRRCPAQPERGRPDPASAAAHQRRTGRGPCGIAVRSGRHSSGAVRQNR
nr:hypothetical protein [Tanacetum cinerariifolium]